MLKRSLYLIILSLISLLQLSCSKKDESGFVPYKLTELTELEKQFHDEIKTTERTVMSLPEFYILNAYNVVRTGDFSICNNTYAADEYSAYRCRD